MGSMSLIHWLIILITLATLFVPAARILKRAGFSPWWVLLGLIPGVSVVAYWVFAFIPWPALDRPRTEA
jgi:hypothetical protein